MARKISYSTTSSSAALIERYNEQMSRKEQVLTNSEDAVIYAIQVAGKPSAIKTGIKLHSANNESITISVALLPQIVANTGLVLLNPIQKVEDGQEIVLFIANLARNVQTISKGSLLAVLDAIDTANAEFVEATAQTTTPKRTRTRKEVD